MSATEKPEPETSIVVPMVADDVLNVTLGDATPVSVKLADAESSPGLATAVIVYVPASAVATVNEPLRAPSDIEHV